VTATGAQDGEVREIIDLLHQNGLLHREKGQFFPAAPMEKIPLTEICEMVLGNAEEAEGPAGIIAGAIREAGKNRAINGNIIPGEPVADKAE